MVTSWIGSCYTLYPGLLTPVFVIGSTNVGESLVELFICIDAARHWMDMWGSGTFPEKPQVGECTSNPKHRPQIVRESFVGLEKWVWSNLRLSWCSKSCSSCTIVMPDSFTYGSGCLSVGCCRNGKESSLIPLKSEDWKKLCQCFDWMLQCQS